MNKAKHNSYFILYFYITMFFVVQLFSTYLTAKASQIQTTINENDLHARSAVLLDADSGRVLYSKNGDEQLAMASTTKIMTCITALENGNIDDVITVSAYAAGMPDVQLNIKEGEHYYLKDLLYSLILESHNDTAVAIAEHIGGSVEGFAALMNNKAKEIGCNNTYFITPNGLDSMDGNGKHSTTASDLAKIMSYCIKSSVMKDKFIEITQTPSYSLNNIIINEDGSISRGTRTFNCSNHNLFLKMMDGVISGKTGFTGDAGYCYVGAIENDDRTFVVALLACGWPNNKNFKWADTKKLMEYGIQNYRNVKLDEIELDGSRLEPIMVTDAQSDVIGQVVKVGLKVEKKTEGDVNQLNRVLLRMDENIEIEYEIENELQAPVIKGTPIGVIKYMLNGEPLIQKVIIIDNDIKKIDYKWCIEKVLEKIKM